MGRPRLTPFAHEIVIPPINYMAHLNIGVTSRYGFKPSFNRTYEVPDSPTGWWVSPYHFGIDQRLPRIRGGGAKEPLARPAQEE